MDWNDLVRQWQAALRRRGRSPNTLNAYAWAVNRLSTWLDGRPISVGQLRAWQDSLAELRPASRLVAANAVRSLLRWAARERLGSELGIEPGLWEWVELPTVPERLPRALDPETLRRLLRWFAARRRDLGWQRDRALFLFLLTSSLRVSEALSLRRDQVERRQIVVTQKGGGEQQVVVSARTREWVTDYLRVRGRDSVPALWVAVHSDGSRAALTAGTANRIWRRHARRLGVEPWTCHVLRHTGATELLEHGATELDVARHLGHRGLATVQRYAAVRLARRQELVDRLDDLVPTLPPVGSRRRATPPARARVTGGPGD